jgi:hypothetical protein
VCFQKIIFQHSSLNFPRRTTSEEDKTKMNPVNEEAFSPKKPHLVTVKTNRDTKQATAIDVPQIVHDNQRKSPTATDHVNQSAMTSNLLASGKSSMDTLGTFYHSSRRTMEVTQHCITCTSISIYLSPNIC